MTIIDADVFLEYLIFSKHIDNLKCKEVREAIEISKVDTNLTDNDIAELQAENKRLKHLSKDWLMEKKILTDELKKIKNIISEVEEYEDSYDAVDDIKRIFNQEVVNKIMLDSSL